MNILITGGCGFIGSTFAVTFRAAGHAVLCFDNLSRHGSEILRDRAMEHGCRFIHGDIRNSEDFNKIKDTCDVMIECSAEPSVMMGTQGGDARYMLNVNLGGALNCFEWARERKVPVLFLSTSRVYPYIPLNSCHFKEISSRFELSEGSTGITPDGVSVSMPLSGVRSLYGATKLCAELVLQEYAAQYGLPALINRCGVVAGPWQLGKVDQGVFTFWMASHYFKRPLKYIGFWGQGKQVRDLLHAEDLAELILKQLSSLQTNARSWSGGIYNVGGGRHANLSLRETTELCATLTGHRMTIGQESGNRPADIIWYITDILEARRDFNCPPRRSATQIMQDTFTWMNENENRCRGIFA